MPGWLLRDLSLSELQAFLTHLRLAIGDLALPKA
jgi:hypothetical protein